MTGDEKNTELRGRKLAEEYLQRKGLIILQRDYRNREGEIDLIAQDKNTVVFVAVKTKTEEGSGSPYEMVGGWKLVQIQRMGEMYCQEFDWEGVCRIDVVSIFQNRQSGSEIEHYENVSGQF